jgi:O-antigen/teichoic acid export membrane protein
MINIRTDSFLKATGILVGGTAIGQIVALIALPLITRIYNPYDFNTLAIYASVLAILSSIVCMRFDAAIPLPEDEDDANNLLFLALMFTAAITLLLVLVVVFFGKTLAQMITIKDFSYFLWLVPFGAAFVGLYSAFQFMAVRRKAFVTISHTKLTQAGAGIGAQVFLGFAVSGPIGLMVGHTLMSVAGVFSLGLQVLRPEIMQAPFPSWSVLVKTVAKYKRFPQYSVAEELVNSAGTQIPILLIGIYTIGPEAGYLFLAMRVLGAPMGIIGSAVSQVYYSHAGQYERDGELAEETVKIFKRLSTWLVLPMVTFGPFVPDIFRFVFGQEWGRAGTLLVWMLPWYAFQFIASPISMVMYVRNLQGWLLVLSLLGLLIRVVPLSTAIFIAPEYLSKCFAISSAIYYSILLLSLLIAAKVQCKKAFFLVMRSFFLWAVFAALSFSIINGKIFF